MTLILFPPASITIIVAIEDKQNEKKISSEEMSGVMRDFTILNLDISFMTTYKEDGGRMIIKKLQRG